MAVSQTKAWANAILKRIPFVNRFIFVRRSAWIALTKKVGEFENELSAFFKKRDEQIAELELQLSLRPERFPSDKKFYCPRCVAYTNARGHRDFVTCTACHGWRPVDVTNVDDIIRAVKFSFEQYQRIEDLSKWKADAEFKIKHLETQNQNLKDQVLSTAAGTGMMLRDRVVALMGEVDALKLELAARDQPRIITGRPQRSIG